MRDGFTFLTESQGDAVKNDPTLVTTPYLVNDAEFEKQKRMIKLFGREVIPAL